MNMTLVQFIKQCPKMTYMAVWAGCSVRWLHEVTDAEIMEAEAILGRFNTYELEVFTGTDEHPDGEFNKVCAKLTEDEYSKAASVWQAIIGELD
jgi:hypothetical protein